MGNCFMNKHIASTLCKPSWPAVNMGFHSYPEPMLISSSPYSKEEEKDNDSLNERPRRKGNDFFSSKLLGYGFNHRKIIGPGKCTVLY